VVPVAAGLLGPVAGGWPAGTAGPTPEGAGGLAAAIGLDLGGWSAGAGFRSRSGSVWGCAGPAALAAGSTWGPPPRRESFFTPGSLTWNQIEPSSAVRGPAGAGGCPGGAGDAGCVGVGGSLLVEGGEGVEGAWVCCLARAAAIFASRDGVALGLPCRWPGCWEGSGSPGRALRPGCGPGRPWGSGRACGPGRACAGAPPGSRPADGLAGAGPRSAGPSGRERAVGSGESGGSSTVWERGGSAGVGRGRAGAPGAGPPGAPGARPAGASRGGSAGA